MHETFGNGGASADALPLSSSSQYGVKEGFGGGSAQGC